MKILFVCENYYPYKGGAETLFQNLAERFVKEGHTVSILTHQLKGTSHQETMNGVNIIRVPSWYSRYIFSFAAILPALKLARTHDLIQTTTFNGAFPAWIAAKLTHKPVILTVHEVWIRKWDQVTSFPKWKCAIHDLLERCLYLLPYSQYICVSNATRDDLLKIKPHPEKIKTIYNGIDYDFWNPARVSNVEIERVRTELNLAHKWIYFSWGRPGESKGFEYLINAVPLISKEIPNSILVLMLGSVEQYPKKYQELLQQINYLGIEKEIKLIPSTPSEQLQAYLKAADCIVIPSIAEGFGYSAVEASSMGTPTLVSNAGSLPEVMSGKYRIFKNKDSQDLAQQIKNIANGKCLNKKLHRFEWAATVKEYLAVYKQLLSLKKEKSKP